jgi:hypothetical protein
MPTPIESMRLVARRLVPLNVPFVFVGGAVMPLLVDQPELTDIRPTKDIDVVGEGFEKFLQDADFRDAFSGHLSGLTGARQRAPLVMHRFEAIAREK